MSAAPELSIVIPTRDGAGKLARCLDAVERDADGLAVETIVVDDGSRDGTPELLAARPQLVAIRLEGGGRGAVRNPAVARARGPVVLFLDDDVVLTPGVLRRHLDHHAAHPEGEAVLQGPVTWAPELEITPHMRWLEAGGPLFAFDTIGDPGDVPWRHFCTANVSLKRAFLPADGPFEETLARCEDVELGWRLHRAGMRLRYDSAALVHHLRRDTPASTEARMRVVGAAMRAVHGLHPELSEPPPPLTRAGRAKAAVARAVRPLLPRAARRGVEERLWSSDAARAYAEGYRAAPATATPSRRKMAGSPEPVT